MKLYSYCIPVDDGAAPNPFWGVCTLAICKPAIRRVAQKGDWVVGTGSTRYQMEKKVVYAMEITKVLTMAKYYEHCAKSLAEKIPDITHSDIRRRAGDCQYKPTPGGFIQLRGVHNSGNKEKDLRGENVLLSDHFYYFGNKPVPLPPNLLSIVKQGQGHKSGANDHLAEVFVEWMTTSPETKPYKNQIKSEPQLLTDIFGTIDGCSHAECRAKDNEPVHIIC